MADFKAKMHQIVCRLGLRPKPRWGSLQRSPRPPSWILGGLLLREGRRERGKGGEEKGGEGRGREGEERGPPAFPLHPPAATF